MTTTLHSYDNAVARLYALGHELAEIQGQPRRFDLEHMRVLAEALGHPERRFPSVLVAGTNGKGSTSSSLAAIAKAAGYRTGLYTSPHLVRINERIQLDGEPISDVEFAEMFARVDEVARALVAAGHLPQLPSFFETLTGMAFEYFASARADLVVLEVGMGGRLDATNVADPCISVITDVSLDHEKYLGNTVAEIAREKAGIIRQNGVLVTLPQHPEANDVIGNTAMERGARAVNAARYVPPVSPGAGKFAEFRRRPGAGTPRNRYPLTVMGAEIQVDSPLVGRHQLRNIALAIATAEELNGCGFRITPADIEQGLRETRWPGRFQVLGAAASRPQVIVDVGHNPAGAWALRSALSEYADGREFTLVFGAMRDKAIGPIAEILFPLARNVVLTRVDAPRAATTDEIRAASPVAADAETASDVPRALARAFELEGPEGLVVITGSVYLAGEALKLL